MDDVEDIKKLVPKKKTSMLLSMQARIAVEEGRSWQVFVAACVWGISRNFILEMMEANN